MIIIDKPSTIHAVSPGGRCTIVDTRGDVHYTREMTRGRKFQANIPNPGKYFCNFQVKEKTDLIHYPVEVDLPKPDRNFKKTRPVEYWPELTGTPARNYFVMGLIVVGPKFRRLPFPVRLFILEHEMGHFKYADETHCDLYALDKVINEHKQNYSQAFNALYEVLNMNSPENLSRVKEIYKHCKFIKK